MRRALISIIAIAGKEIRQTLRQPKLIGALILGPFAILGLFAAGFQADPPPLRTIVVAQEGSVVTERLAEIEEVVGSALELIGTTDDEQAAKARLQAGEADAVVIAPSDPAATIRSGDHAQLTIVHDRLDPFDRTYISASSDAAVDDLNRAILRRATVAAQDRSATLAENLPAAREAAARLTETVEGQDQSEVDRAADEVLTELEGVDSQWMEAADVVRGVEGESSDDGSVDAAGVADLRAGDPASVERARQLEADLAELEQVATDLRSIPPEVLTQPFVAETQLLSAAEVPLTSYYTPAVLIVLLQHVMLTFAAVSLVREREVGATDLFRIGPLRTSELVFGKFLGYGILGVLVAAVLAVAIVFGLDTPMSGSWWWMAAVLGLTMVASLGIGFVIAAASGSAAQAVQFAMLALLFTIFFGGLVASLDRLVVGVRQLTLIAPATSGTAALQDVMFRGIAPSFQWLAVLAVLSVGSFAIALLWLRRRQVA